MGCFISSLHSLHNAVQWGHVKIGDLRWRGGSDQTPGTAIIIIITVVTVYQGPTHACPSHLHSTLGRRIPSVGVLSHFSRVQLWRPKEYTMPSSSSHGILQARIWERVAMLSPMGSPQRGIKTESPMSPALPGRFFTTNASWEDWRVPCLVSVHQEVTSDSGRWVSCPGCIASNKKREDSKPVCMNLELSSEHHLLCTILPWGSRYRVF